MRPTTSRYWYKSLTSEELRTMVANTTLRLLRWGNRRVPVGVRSVIGIFLMVAGVFGFLPIIGFWMFPIGLAFVALDIPWTRKHIHDWMERLEKRVEQAR